MATKSTIIDFIANAVCVHGDKYDYSEAYYINSRTNIKIICPEHGEFWQKANNHLRRHGCPECGSYRTHNRNKRNWNFEQPEEYKLIPLTKGKFTIVDNEDFEKLKNINWYYRGSYALNDTVGQMHRHIMECPEDMFVDHRNGDGLDNRKENLRICTHQQNIFNKKSSSKSTSKYKGVYWSKNSNKWMARININNKVKYLGIYNLEEEAGKAYDKKAMELFGVFARLNFPELKEEYLKQIK